MRIEFIEEEEVSIHLACPKTDGCLAELATIGPCLWLVLAQPHMGWVAGTWWRRLGSGLVGKAGGGSLVEVS